MSILDFFKKKSGSDGLSDLCRLAKNEIRMDPNPHVQTIRADGSKIGGKPYLPADFVWPVFTSQEDHVTRPLSFFCQIDLAEMQAYDKDKRLPANGLLSFFYECESFCWGFDPKDRGSARVFYFENTSDFVSLDWPQDLREDYRIPEMAVAFTAKPSYPKYEELEYHSDADCDWERYEKALEALGIDTEADSEGHKLLGYADIIQNEMLSECERVIRGMYVGDAEEERTSPDDADIQEKAKDWLLLLQLGTIETDDFTWMFGDCGMLYYYIKQEDLAAKRFENAWFSVQCG